MGLDRRGRLNPFCDGVLKPNPLTGTCCDEGREVEGLNRETLLEGSEDLVSRVISPLIWVVTIVILLLTLLITTQ